MPVVVLANFTYRFACFPWRATYAQTIRVADGFAAFIVQLDQRDVDVRTGGSFGAEHRRAVWF